MAFNFYNTAVEAQLSALEAQLAITPAGTPQWTTLNSQIVVLENEIAESPVVPPIFYPNNGGGGRGRR